ncbi:hypothetical protein [Methanobacterium ferruginis]|uniref:hypothetical protein n=1 Tax=Methanobacterium ferruginis TaxID=710191 RepID=UPI0025727A64|nr:hypothetical protein [Methanobacterium ferruginis]BDZ68613.1 hypothetical protein GCM10025860_20610 [Methanobacterium ferruginis]
MVSFKPKETCREVINYVKGTWTDENNETHTVTVSDQTSIDNYGKCISPTVFTGETEAEVTTKVNEELAQKKDPIFSGTLILAGFALYEPGTQINFNDDDEYSSFLFTVVDWNYDGPSNQTTMDLTTDETVTSVPNEAELMQSVAINEINKVLSDVSIVVAKSEGSDRVIAKSETDGVSRNIRDLNSGET